jgi:hypothetical protein
MASNGEDGMKNKETGATGMPQPEITIRPVHYMRQVN